MKELVEKALEMQKESFQEYLDDGYFESVFGEKKVNEAIPVISSWEFDTSDNAVFHYARISILNELLSELNDKDTSEESKKTRTAWTVENLADWLSKYDIIHKETSLNNSSEPYDKETWTLIVQDVALDYSDSLKK